MVRRVVRKALLRCFVLTEAESMNAMFFRITVIRQPLFLRLGSCSRVWRLLGRVLFATS